MIGLGVIHRNGGFDFVVFPKEMALNPKTLDPRTLNKP